jgi:hypothetical protein
LKSRLNAIAKERRITGRLPFAWRADCPPLTASNALVQLASLACSTHLHAHGAMAATLGRLKPNKAAICSKSSMTGTGAAQPSSPAKST